MRFGFGPTSLVEIWSQVHTTRRMSSETPKSDPEVIFTSENRKKWIPNYGSGGSIKIEIKPFDEKINFGL
jgi:hypothetical protein